MNDEFRFFQRGHTVSLGHKSIAILDRLVVTGNLCNYTENTIVDNFITEIKNREQGISVKARAATKDLVRAEETDYPAAFDFVTYATSRAYIELVKKYTIKINKLVVDRISCMCTVFMLFCCIK